MTSNRRSKLGEIDIERDLISPDLDYDEVVHILKNPTSTETVCIREGLDEIGTGLTLGNRGNIETIHILRKIKLETLSPRKKGDLGMLPWMP